MEKRMVRLVCALAALLLCSVFALGCAAADGDQGGNEVERLLAVQDFKFQQVEKGIGFGVLAVYSAPSTDALRGANGKAAVDTNKKMAEAGYDESGWLLVRYEKDSGGYRVGYVEKRKVKDYKARMATPAFDRIPVTAAETIDVLDDPHERGNVLGTLTAHLFRQLVVCGMHAGREDSPRLYRAGRLRVLRRGHPGKERPGPGRSGGFPAGRREDRYGGHRGRRTQERPQNAGRERNDHFQGVSRNGIPRI